ncbi:unnamed protein product [Brachionus calyciflorus]|uniref:Uncharacterized protein n=1 Tax=Brachionus calyciflorus TaxID=104777 RepID=A0A813UDE8_9BILA|nr:unnamed protein product [Brachionus calyciflorus]
MEINPFFNFNDIKIKDLKEEPYVDPYYYLRRPIEPERLKSIYQQAFIFDLLYRFAKEYLPDINEVSKEKHEINENEKNTDTTIDSIKEKILEYLFKNQIEVKDEKESNKIEETIINDNLWSIEEWNILRKNFNQIKNENISLKSRVAVLIDENNELREKLANFESQTKFLPDQVKTLEKANERLYIRVQEMENRYVNYKQELESLDETIKELKEKENDLKSILNESTSEKLKLELEINKLKVKLDSCKNELKSYFMAKCERYKLKYIKQIEDLKTKLDDAGDSLEREKAGHEKCKKGLEQLRNHFMYAFVPGEYSSKVDESKISIT